MVATVTRLSEAASTVHYFETDGYYAKNDKEHHKASRWHGRGVEALGLHGPVKPKRFEEVLSGRIPGTTTRLGRLREGKHEHRAGLDTRQQGDRLRTVRCLPAGEGESHSPALAVAHHVYLGGQSTAGAAQSLTLLVSSLSWS